MRIVCISDTHGFDLSRITIPDGDVLIHAGDATRTGKIKEMESVARQMLRLPHQHKIMIAGNHDWLFIDEPELARNILDHAGIIYLQDSEVNIDGLHFYGSPWQPVFFDWAFNLHHDELVEKWAMIPDYTDVLITHSPAFGLLDRNKSGQHCGCPALFDALKRVKPRAHIFGHIHEDHGCLPYLFGDKEICLVNASVCTFHYRPDNPVIVIDV